MAREFPRWGHQPLNLGANEKKWDQEEGASLALLWIRKCFHFHFSGAVSIQCKVQYSLRRSTKLIYLASCTPVIVIECSLASYSCFVSCVFHIKPSRIVVRNLNEITNQKGIQDSSKVTTCISCLSFSSKATMQFTNLMWSKGIKHKGA